MIGINGDKNILRYKRISVAQTLSRPVSAERIYVGQTLVELTSIWQILPEQISKRLILMVLIFEELIYVERSSAESHSKGQLSRGHSLAIKTLLMQKNERVFHNFPQHE